MTVDELARPGRLRLRLRVPTQRGDDPGLVTVEVLVGEPPQPLDGCQIMELTFSWGASADNGVVTTADAGTGTIRLADPDRLLDPTNLGALAGIGTAVRIVLNGITAFRGRIDDVQHDLMVATLALTDGVAALAAIQFVETNVPAESTSARITRILDLAAWPADRRDIGSGGRSLQAGTVSADAWSELLKVTRNELGALWLTSDGKVAFRNRTTAWTGGAPVMTFGCPPSDAFIGTMTTRGDQSDLVNVLSAARRGGTQATVSDATSLGRYGRHSHVQNDLELSTDDERDLWQSFYLVRQANPALGIAGFSTRPDTRALSALLALPLGAIVRVYDEHHGPVIDRTARWLGAKWKVAPAYVELDAVTGEDASIKQVARSTTLDTMTEWQAAEYALAVAAGNALGPGFGSLLANGSFESDLTGWTVAPAGSPVSIDTTAANVIAGTKAAKIIGNGSAVSPGIALTTFVPVVVGETVRLRAWAKRLAGTVATCRVVMHTKNSAGSHIGNEVISLQWAAGSSSTGLYLEGWYTIPAGIASVAVGAYLTGTPANTESWTVDDVTLVGGNVAYGDAATGQPGLIHARVSAE